MGCNASLCRNRSGSVSSASSPRGRAGIRADDRMGWWWLVTGADTVDDGGDGRLSMLYGVVRFEAGEERRVRDTTITFDSSASAELFAVESGWDAYQVCPLFFFVDTATAPAAGRMLLGAALARSVRRAGGR